MEYRGQLLQDRFVDDFYKQRRNGIYLDIGAHNGKDLSNTYFLEHSRDWSGILIEPIDEEFEKLKSCRGEKNRFFKTAVSDYDGQSVFRKIVGDEKAPNMLSGLLENIHPIQLQRIQKETFETNSKVYDVDIQVRTLQSILDECEMFEFDFCSLDVEGSELPILKSIDWNRTNIKMFIIENNYGVEEQITPYLEQYNYDRFGFLQWDVVYVKNTRLV